MNELLAGQIIQWLPEKPDKDAERNFEYLERILWLDHEKQEAVVISMSRKNREMPFVRPLDEINAALLGENAIIRNVDPYDRLVNPQQEYPESHLKRRDDAWDLIKDIVREEPDIFDKSERWSKVKGVISRSKAAAASVCKHLVNYWKRGNCKNALLPAYNFCGAPGEERLASACIEVDHLSGNGPSQVENKAKVIRKRGRPSRLSKHYPDRPGVNVTTEDAMIMRIAFKRFLRKKFSTLSDTYQDMLENFYNIGKLKDGTPILTEAHLVPTKEQFYYRYRKYISLAEALLMRKGKREFQLNSRPVLGNSTRKAFGPGAIFQIDATIADIFLVWAIDRTKIIGRPVIYFCIDVFSRMIVGLHVALEGPSWATGMMALANAMSDKVAYCARYGIEITKEMWPACYVPSKLLTDRGEFISIASDQLVNAFDMEMQSCPPYRGDFKGIVERMFGKANEKTIHWAPGAVKERTPGQKDYRIDATLDINEFTALLIDMVLEHNLTHRLNTDCYPLTQDMIQDNVEPIPINLWEWGIEKRSGTLRQKSESAVRLALMPQTTATVTERGICANKMYYSCSLAVDEGWFTVARVKKRFSYIASYDPRNIDEIWLHLPDNSVTVCQRLRDENNPQELFTDCSLEDVEEHFELESLRKKLDESRARQAKAGHNNQRGRIIANAEKKTKAARASDDTSNTQKTKAIGKNREAAREEQRQLEAWRSENATEHPEEPAQDEAVATDGDPATPQPSVFRSARERMLIGMQY